MYKLQNALNFCTLPINVYRHQLGRGPLLRYSGVYRISQYHLFFWMHNMHVLNSSKHSLPDAHPQIKENNAKKNQSSYMEYSTSYMEYVYSISLTVSSKPSIFPLQTDRAPDSQDNTQNGWEKHPCLTSTQNDIHFKFVLTTALHAILKWFQSWVI